MTRLSHRWRKKRVRIHIEHVGEPDLLPLASANQPQLAPTLDTAEPKPIETKVDHYVDWLDIRRPLQPTAGTPAEAYRDANQLANIAPRLRGLLTERTLHKAIEADKFQIPATVNREGYCDGNHFEYWLSGLADLRMVERLAPAAKYTHVLDFGGASGRFARHIPFRYPSAKVTIADLNINHVDWIDQHFGPSIRGVKVSALPHFPLADNSVTLCVGFSVFTHIDTYESGWLTEIHRVLAKKCYAVLTVHSEHVWTALPSFPWIYNVLQANPEFKAIYTPGAPMPQERLVYKYVSTSNEYNCNVFMTSEYIRRAWGRWFDVVAIAPRAHHDYQTTVVLRKLN